MGKGALVAQCRPRGWSGEHVWLSVVGPRLQEGEGRRPAVIECPGCSGLLASGLLFGSLNWLLWVVGVVLMAFLAP